MWNSVLWNDDNYRPDKLAMCLNSTEDFYELDVMDNVKKMNLIFWDTLSARTAFLKLAANLNIDLSRTETQSSLEFGKFCDEIQKHVMWNGERFVPKPLNLTRIYLEQDHQKELKVRTDFLTTAIIVPDIGDNSLVEQPFRRWNDDFLTNRIIDILNRRRFTSRPNNDAYLKTSKTIPNSKLLFLKKFFSISYFITIIHFIDFIRRPPLRIRKELVNFFMNYEYEVYISLTYYKLLIGFNVFFFPQSVCPVHLEPVGDNLLELKGEITGPPGTPYEGATFQLEIKIPQQYPFERVKIRFVTKIWHPNVSLETGTPCFKVIFTVILALYYILISRHSPPF